MILGARSFISPTPAAPVNVSAPVVSGLAFVGLTLSVTTGSWSGYPYPTFTYVWRADGIAIPGETSSTLVLTVAEEGAVIDCVVTATNDQGTASQASNQVGPVAPLPFGDALSLESGDYLLLESGDKLLLESA